MRTCECFDILYVCCMSGKWVALQAGSISSSRPPAVLGEHFLTAETPALIVDLDGKRCIWLSVGYLMIKSFDLPYANNGL